MKITSLFALSFIVLGLFLPFLQVQAQLTPACGYDLNSDGKYDSQKEGCKLCHFFVLGNNILKFLLVPPGGLVLIGAVIMFVVGGFMFLVSAGNPSSLEQGRNILKTTVMGLIIVYGAWLAVDFFFVALGVTTWSGPGQGWFTINCPIP